MHLFLTLNRFHALFSVSIVHIVEQVNIRWDLNRHHCTDHQRLGSGILIVKSGRICYFLLVSLILYELVYCQLDRCWSEPIKYTAKHKMYHIPVDHENSEISLLGSVREAFLFLNINVTLSWYEIFPLQSTQIIHMMLCAISYCLHNLESMKTPMEQDYF